MKIVLFIDCLGAGGAQRQLVGLARMLNEIGHEVSVVVYHDIPFYASLLEECGVPCYLIGQGKVKGLLIYSFYQYVKYTKPDWVISYLESPCIIACLVRMLYKRFRLIVSERNTSQQMNGKCRLRFNIFRVADYVVPNSFSQQSFIEKHAGFLSDRTRTITNFVDMEFFKPSENKQFRHEMQEIIVVASIWPPKNTLNFICAVEILLRKTQNFHISWYGKNKGVLLYFEECNRLIKEKRLSDHIELLDKTSEIKRKYQAADLFCLPSFYEGTPNVIGEAIACGLPVVCSNVCDNPIYVKEGVNGFLFDPNLPQDMADKLLKALNMKMEDYVLYSRQSRVIAEKLLSKNKFIDSYLKLLRS